MVINKTYLAFCVAGIALFFVGRCSHSPVVIDNKHVMDSLTIAAKLAHNNAEIYKQNAQKAFQKGVESQKTKVVIRTIYRAQIVKNHAMRPTEKDSTIKESLHVPYSDSSMFTEPVANGILDLGSENKMLKLNAYADSVTNASMGVALHNIELAFTESGKESEVKSEIISEERTTNRKLRKEIRRQKIYKWFAVSGVFVVGTLAIISN